MQRPDIRMAAAPATAAVPPPGNPGGPPPDSVVRHADSLLSRWLRQDPVWRAAQLAFARGERPRALAHLRRLAERPGLTAADRRWLRRQMALCQAPHRQVDR
ncbi:MAG: hypothetical protein ACKO5K_15375 [Armatimonadota bacterium]